MIQMATGLWNDETGLTTVEYALLLALLVVAAIAHWTLLGMRVQETVSSSTDAFDQVTGNGFGCGS